MPYSLREKILNQPSLSFYEKRQELLESTDLKHLLEVNSSFKDQMVKLYLTVINQRYPMCDGVQTSSL